MNEEGVCVKTPDICHTNPTVMKLGTVILYPKKIQKIYKSHNSFRQFH